MDPYLELPALWPDVHNSLMVAIRDALAPILAPRYYIALERRMYLLGPDDLVLVGRADLAVLPHAEPQQLSALPLTEAGVIEVEVLMEDEVGENYLEVHETGAGKLVTVLELLSPANKLHAKGRETYEQKRRDVFRSRTNLVEVDLLRAGGDYRIVIMRGSRRPRGQMHAFALRQPIPSFPLPLLPGEVEPLVDLNAILHALYDRARFDLRLDYTQPPVPPLHETDAAWANELINNTPKA
jgi:hypothetical protein